MLGILGSNVMLRKFCYLCCLIPRPFAERVPQRHSICLTDECVSLKCHWIDFVRVIFEYWFFINDCSNVFVSCTSNAKQCSVSCWTRL